MRGGRIRAAIISTDDVFRSTLQGREDDLSVALELDRPFAEIRDTEIKKIRLCAPRVIVLDLDDDPEMGCQLAGYLVENVPEARVMVAGTDVPQNVLMAAIQAGVSECVAKPLTDDELDEALARLERKLGPRTDGREQGRVLAFLGAKGGAGTTTVATNVAIQIHALTGRRTVLVDLDLELGEVALFLGLETQFSLIDVARNLHRLDEGLMENFVARHSSGVDLVAAPSRAGEGDGVRQEEIRRVLRFMRDHYAHVVVDAANSPTRVSRAALEEADEVYVVSQVDVPSIRNVQRFRHLLEAGRRLEPFRLVVNRFQPDGEIGLQDVEKSLGTEVFWTLTNDYSTVVSAINTGEPFALKSSGGFAREVEGLASKITGVAPERPDREKAGWLARALGRGSKNGVTGGGRARPGAEPASRPTREESER